MRLTALCADLTELLVLELEKDYIADLSKQSAHKPPWCISLSMNYVQVSERVVQKSA